MPASSKKKSRVGKKAVARKAVVKKVPGVKVSPRPAKKAVRKVVAKTTSPLHIRVDELTRELIEQASSASGQDVSDFVRTAARTRANEVLLDRVVFPLSDQGWAEFQAALDADDKPNKALVDLMKRKAPWE